VCVCACVRVHLCFLDCVCVCVRRTFQVQYIGLVGFVGSNAVDEQQLETVLPSITTDTMVCSVDFLFSFVSDC
jgi:hypothetical protein